MAPWESGRAPCTVSELVKLVKGHVGALGSLVVSGEVTGFRGPQRNSGHCYFSIRDEKSSLDVIVWRNVYLAAAVELKDGMLIELTGALDVYDKTGKMSFVAKHLELAGEGLLRQQVAALERKLAAEGLMSDERKRPVPEFCSRICVVTSLSGSVREDVRRTLERRNPLVQIDYVGCAVQGTEAPPTIIRALNFSASTAPDAILLVRGGGSYEDLMCFNDEALARAIAACPVPVVTGIGHEPDDSIADKVADRRCSTPTAAAESVAPALSELTFALDSHASRLRRFIEGSITREGDVLTHFFSRAYTSISSQLGTKRAQLDSLAVRPSLQNPAYLIERRVSDLRMSEQRLLDAGPRRVELSKRELANLSQRMRTRASYMLEPLQAQLAKASSMLDALSPLKVLSRGYAIVRDEAGHVVSQAAQTEPGRELSVRLNQGSLKVHVDEISTEDSGT